MDAPAYGPEDVSAVVATTAGEGANQPPLAQRYIASTILNRARLTGEKVADIAGDAQTYNGADSHVAKQAVPGSALYNTVASNISPVLQNGPVTTATHFINHDLQAQEGRDTPAWAKGDDGIKVGDHTFYDRSDQLSSPIPSDDQLAADFAKSQSAPARQLGMPYDAQYGVTRNADGSIYGLPSGVSVTLTGDGATADQRQPVTTPDTNPDRIARFLKDHPEDVANHIGEPSDEQLAKDYQTAFPAGPQDQPPGKPALPAPNIAEGGALPAPKNALEGTVQNVDAGIRSFTNAVTGGFADKGDAAFSALMGSGGDLSKWGPQYTSNMNALEARNASYKTNVPIAHYGGAIGGTVGQALLLPEAKAAGLAGRVVMGMKQGAALSGLDAMGHARGGLPEEVESAVVPTALGTVLGGGLGGALGRRVKPVETALSKYAKAGVDRLLAVNGGRAAQQVGSALKGIPFVGSPLARGAARTASQLSDSAVRVAKGLGAAETPFEAGGAVQRGAETAQTKFGVMKDALYGPVNALERDSTPIAVANTQRDIASMFAKYPTVPQWLEHNAPVLKTVRDTLAKAGGHLTFAELKAMRTDVGSLIKDGFNVGGIDQGRLKVLYSAMSRDMEAAAQQLGGKTAYEAMRRANTYNRAVADRVESTLKSVIGDGVRPEQAYSKIIGAASKGPQGDLALLARLKRTLPADEWQEVGANAIFNMGRNGEEFSAAKFGTAWSKLSDEGKRLLFGGKSEDLDAIAAVAKDQVAAEKFYNHSNSGHFGAMVAGAGEMAAGLMVPGNLHKVAAMLALAGAGRGAAELLASPGFARLVLRGAEKPDVMAKALDAYAAANPRVAPLIQAYRTKLLNIANAASAEGLEARTRTPALHIAR